MAELHLVATAASGLEAIVVRELKQLGYNPKILRPGRVSFTGTESDICRANLWLRTADRVLVQLAAFPASDFDALFEQTRDIPWETWVAQDAAIPVRGRSRKSQLTSVPAVQRTVKKAIVERLLEKLPLGKQPLSAGTANQPIHRMGQSPLSETGPAVPVEVAILDDEATISIDTSGDGLHKRGYRKLAAAAQLRETLASALMQLSFWRAGRPMLDPFCGTGTIVIEAAMLGRNLAPGRQRSFAAEHWSAIDAAFWKQAREEADDLAKPILEERILGTDADSEVLSLARYHADQAGVTDDIHFQKRQFEETLSKREYGCIITNPPYGVRMGDDAEVDALYQTMPNILRRLKTWSHYIITARENFEQLVGQPADRRRKLYNGGVACTYYQFHGPRPPRVHDGVNTPDSEATQNKSVESAFSSTFVSEDGISTEEFPRADRKDEVVSSNLAEGNSVQTEQAKPTFDEKLSSKPFAQPSTKQAFGGLSDEAKRQKEEFTNRLRKRAKHFRKWPTKRGITCYRIYDRDIPEIPFAIDRYENSLHIAEYERPHARTPAQHADWLDMVVRTAADVLEVERSEAFLKQRAPQRGSSQYERVAEVNALRTVHEAGLKFMVNLSDYLDTGLFLDHRNTRQLVRDMSDGKRFLNLFSYTGSFSVYAAAGGAIETTTTDLSKNYLDWAQKNMELNGFASSEADHRYIASDVWKFFDTLPANREFDIAVVDPPTFSNSKGLHFDWDVQRDHGTLLNKVLERLSPGGTIFFSNNSRRFKFDESGLQSKNRNLAIREISKQTVPDDFRNKRIHRCWKIVKA